MSERLFLSEQSNQSLESAAYFQGEAKEWQTRVRDMLYQSVDQETILSPILGEMAEITRLQFTQQELISIMDTDEGFVPHHFSLFSCPMANIRDMYAMIQENGVDGLMLRAAHVLDDIQTQLDMENTLFAKKQIPISAWKQSQEMLYLYAPLLEMLGFKSFARECYSAALYCVNMHRFSDDELRDLYGNYAAAERFYQEQSDSLHQSFFSIGPEGSEVCYRLKSWGSYLEKFFKSRKKHGEINACPDTLGFKIVVPDQTSPQELQDLAFKIFSILHDHGMELRHTRANEPVLEVHIQGIQEKQTIELSLPGKKEYIKVILNPPRKSGYQAGHINGVFYFNNILDDIPIGIEVQIVRHRDERENDRGTASHTLYKAKKGSFDPQCPFNKDMLLTDVLEEIRRIGLAYQQRFSCTY